MGRSGFIRENRATIVAATVVAVLIAALLLWQGGRGSGSGRMVALVHDSDGQVHELPLDTDASLTVTTELGSNTIVVESGSVRVAEADCPNGTCTREHPLSEPGAQIICLPHKLWVEVVPEGEEGGQMDVSLAEGIGQDVDLVAR